eukprot:gene16734-biopygen18817
MQGACKVHPRCTEGTRRMHRGCTEDAPRMHAGHKRLQRVIASPRTQGAEGASQSSAGLPTSRTPSSFTAAAGATGAAGSAAAAFPGTLEHACRHGCPSLTARALPTDRLRNVPALALLAVLGELQQHITGTPYPPPSNYVARARRVSAVVSPCGVSTQCSRCPFRRSLIVLTSACLAPPVLSLPHRVQFATTPLCSSTFRA